MIIHSAAQRILDFDIECRPLSWYGGDWVTRDITAIAWSWAKGKRVYSAVMLPDDPLGTQRQMLEEFLVVYSQADIVTGHYIRGFDLPVLNTALMEHAMPPMEGKMSCDTKLDKVKTSGFSSSQENMASVFGLEHDKVGMTQADWRLANRLLPEGVSRTLKRVKGDVRQHKEMREHMLKHGLLTPVRWWSPEGVGFGKYHA